MGQALLDLQGHTKDEVLEQAWTLWNIVCI